MEREAIRDLVADLCYAFNQCEMDDLMSYVRAQNLTQVEVMLAEDVAPEAISYVYAYLREEFESPDVDLVEVAKGQWSSLSDEVRYIARMGRRVAVLCYTGRSYVFGNDYQDSLAGIQQIWQVVDR